MRVLVLDTEVTGATNGTKGNPFSIPNRLCYVGIDLEGKYYSFSVDVDNQPHRRQLEDIRKLLDSSDLIVGFNLKFDFHWLRRYGIQSFSTKKVWDAQTFEYLVSRQQTSYPSLGESAILRGLPTKTDIVKTEYWEKGIDTDTIPRDVILEYLQNDVEITEKLYRHQISNFTGLQTKLQKLISLCNQDLIVLEEMEWNGLPYNLKASLDESTKLQVQLDRLIDELNSILGTDIVNWNSGDHISSVLYGGKIKVPEKEIYTFNYKDGRTAQKQRNIDREYVFPSLIAPLKGSELKKEGYFATDEATLRSLKGSAQVKKIVARLLEISKLDKLRGTYFEGFPKLHDKMMWEGNVLHQQLSQPVTTTGRLASQKPNGQNIPDPVRALVQTQYEKT